MLNEALNNNDVMCVATIMFSKAPNSNDAMMCVAEKCAFKCNGCTANFNGGYKAIMQKS